MGCCHSVGKAPVDIKKQKSQWFDIQREIHKEYSAPNTKRDNNAKMD